MTTKEWRLSQIELASKHKGQDVIYCKDEYTDEEVLNMYEKTMCMYLLDSAELWNGYEEKS